VNNHKNSGNKTNTRQS